MAYKKKKLPRVIKASKQQTGKTTKEIDRMIEALKPGKRQSKSGNIYYERRRNRSDIDPKKRL